MLSRLFISNYALIDTLELSLADRLTIITGETGAGKSIILGALSLILGERAEQRLMRDHNLKTVVEAVFSLEGYNMENFFHDNDIDFYERECIIRREIAPSGRSRAFVNDVPVSLATLRTLTARLVDIHSQHSNMLLAEPAFHLAVIDHMAGDAALLNEYKAAFKSYKELQKKLRDLRDAQQKSKADEDYLRFQLAQLTELALREGEDDELETQQRMLSNATSIKETLWQVDSLLDNDGGSAVVSNVAAIVAELRKIEGDIAEIAELRSRMESVLIELKDIGGSLFGINEQVVDDPARLEWVNERLDTIYSLERKHNVTSSDALLAIAGDITSRLDMIDGGDEQIAECERQMMEAKARASELATRLTAKRKEAASDFERKLLPLATALGMPNLRFSVEFAPVELNADGADAVNFMFAFNKNQPLQHIKDTASGGEVSRLMLCVKAIIARNIQLPTIIFDEVDTGVSGEIASRIGEMMCDIAEHIQVIAITHLPQVAAKGTQHLRVYKTDAETSTLTSVQTLNHEEHVMEVARMLSGKDLNAAAIENAKALIDG